MTNAQLEEALGRLGIDRDRVALVALLPLVHVAWADGEIQPEERALILGIAERHGFVDDGHRRVLVTWLEDAPSPWFFGTAYKVVTALSARAVLPPGLDPREVVAWCWALAAAAGGLFGSSFLAVDAEERIALDQIARGLGVDEVPAHWRTLRL